MSNSPARRWKRVLIQGLLETVTPLHVGSGELGPHLGLKTARKEGYRKENKPIAVALVESLRNGCPIIPGSTLKGALRSYLYPQHRSGKADEERWRRLLGAPEISERDPRYDEEGGQGRGGCVDFWDAVAESPSADRDFSRVPYWDAKRLTGCMAQVAMDRRLGVAREEQLYHLQFVPPGIDFRVKLFATEIDEEELEWLLAGLSGFGGGSSTGDPASAGGLCLGGDTVKGWGQLRWRLSSVRGMDEGHVREWLRAAERPPWREALNEDRCSARIAIDLNTVCRKHGSLSVQSREPVLELAFKLQMTGQFLINDPSRAEQEAQKDKQKAREAKQESEKQTSAVNPYPRYNADGDLVLPASGFRGALRSQAERIVRTLYSGRGAEEAPRGVGAVGKSIERTLSEVPLSFAERVFGASGWQSPIEIEDLIDREPSPVQKEEFVAIDRFLGGATAGKKFHCHYHWQPCFDGKIRIRLKRWHDAGVFEAAIGLWVLLLRDLVEGEVRFGMHQGKGFGQSKLEDLKVSLSGWGAQHDWIETYVSPDSEAWRSLSTSAGPWTAFPEGVKAILTGCVESLRTLKLEGLHE